MLVRDLEKGRDVKARISERSGSDNLHLWQCDLADLASVRRFAELFRAEVPELRALVNNAGAMPPERKQSADGLELTFATNVAGPFLLTSLLLEPLRARRPGPRRQRLLRRHVREAACSPTTCSCEATRVRPRPASTRTASAAR